MCKAALKTESLSLSPLKYEKRKKKTKDGRKEWYMSRRKGKVMDKLSDTSFWSKKSNILLQGSQALPTRPSDKDSV
jgi:hypothetical protein